jgi:membrane-associated protein
VYPTSILESFVDALTQGAHFLISLLNPTFLEELLRTWGWLGYPLLFAIIFSETGLLIGFFLPGDSLLFIAGFIASQGILHIGWLNLLLMVGAVSGDAVGYHLGKKIGPKIFTRDDSLFFHKSHIIKTQAFYEKHGGKTIILARFVPIIRTFAPFVAGMASMTYRRFLSFNVFGGIGWIASVSLAGYLFGNIPIVRRNFEKVVILIIFVSVLPLVFEYVRAKFRKVA